MIKIDKGIPIPNADKGGKYPFHAMNVGDSFFVEGKKAFQMAGTVGQQQNRNGKRFTTRTVDGGTRVWRIA